MEKKKELSRSLQELKGTAAEPGAHATRLSVFPSLALLACSAVEFPSLPEFLTKPDLRTTFAHWTFFTSYGDYRWKQHFWSSSAARASSWGSIFSLSANVPPKSPSSSSKMIHADAQGLPVPLPAT